MFKPCSYLIVVLIYLVEYLPSTRANATVDIRLHDLQVTNKDCVGRTCTLKCDMSVPSSGVNYTFSMDAPSDPNQILRLGDMLSGGTHNKFTFPVKMHKDPEKLPNPPKFIITCQLSFANTKYHQSTLETLIHHLLTFKPNEERAPYYQLRLAGFGIILNMLVRGYCAPGFYGPACNEQCVYPPSFINRTVWCDKEKIYCRKGWTGFNCQLRDPCNTANLKPCQNEATCIPTYTPGLGPFSTATFKCECRPGWQGYLCSQPVLYGCQHPNGTMATFSEWGYQWKNDGLDQAIQMKPNSGQTVEPYMMPNPDSPNTGSPVIKWRRVPPLSIYTKPFGQSGSAEPQIVWRSDKDPDTVSSYEAMNLNSASTSRSMWRNTQGTERDQETIPIQKESMYTMWREVPKEPSAGPSVLSMWRSADASDSKPTPYPIPQEPANTMWRQSSQETSAGPSSHAMWRKVPETESQSGTVMTVKVEEGKKDVPPATGFTMWRLFTNMEPMAPVPVKPGPIYSCCQIGQNLPPNLRIRSPPCPSGGPNMTFQQLAECPGYNWTVNCYEVPCLLLQGHPTRLPLNELYVPWRATLVREYPQFVNLKPAITFTPMVLRDGSAVTSANFHCTQNGNPLPQGQLLYAFQQLPLQTWTCCLPTPVVSQIRSYN